LLTSAIYRATLDELAETGFDRLSFDKIATSAGTGKAALYRRWTTPAELVLDALTDPLTGFGDIPVPGTGSLRGDLVFLLGGFARIMQREPRGRALFPLITQRQHHPELYASLRRMLLEPGQQRILDVLRAAAGRGEVDPAAVTPRIAALGPRLVMADLLEHGTVAPTEVEAIVDEVLLPVLARRH
jgi:AcrR family transcriptional regulator